MKEVAMGTILDQTGHDNNVHELFSGERGFGFGRGLISRAKQLLSGELRRDREQQTLEYIQYDIGAFVPIESDDDGCSDGRAACAAERVMPDGTVVKLDSNRIRAKVFGGGAMMTTAGFVASGKIAQSPLEQIQLSVDFLNVNSMSFGAHDDDHASEDNCGCGAIDRYIDNMQNTQLFRTEIRDSLQALLGTSFNDDVYQRVSDNFKQAAIVAKEHETAYSGRKVRGIIAKTGAVIKRLTNTHQEDFIVINNTEGTTLNQAGLAEISNNEVQAFSIDAWRLGYYANALAGNDDDARTQALYGMLIYTLATSATLTDGSLRVLIRG